MGVEASIRYRCNRRQRPAPGQILMIGTDGVFEAHNQANEMFGKTRFMEAIRKSHREPAQRILESVQKDLEHFTGQAPQADDITLVVVKFTG